MSRKWGLQNYFFFVKCKKTSNEGFLVVNNAKLSVKIVKILLFSFLYKKKKNNKFYLFDSYFFKK